MEILFRRCSTLGTEKRSKSNDRKIEAFTINRRKRNRHTLTASMCTFLTFLRRGEGEVKSKRPAASALHKVIVAFRKKSFYVSTELKAS